MKIIMETTDKSSQAVTQGEDSIRELSEKIDVIRDVIGEVASQTVNISHTLQEQTQAANEVSQGISDIAHSSKESVEGIEKVVDSMASVETLITAQINNVADLTLPSKIVKLAQSDHVLWVKRLANMVAGKEGLNPDELANHHSCRLGKWYDGVTSHAYTDNSDFKALVDPHEKVHAHGIRAVRLFNDGKTEDALAEIKHVEENSKEVLRLLKALEAVEAAA
jgi:methyl-accepting chemotaxis protein